MAAEVGTDEPRGVGCQTCASPSRQVQDSNSRRARNEPSFSTGLTGKRKHVTFEHESWSAFEYKTVRQEEGGQLAADLSAGEASRW